MPRSRTRTGRWSAPPSALTWPHRLWDFKKPLPVERRLRRRRRRLQPAGLARRGARQQAARPLHASRSAATATSCSRRARCGPPRITESRCSTSCRTIAPIIRNTCIWPRWRRGTAAASSKARYRHDAHGSEYRLRHGGARLGRLRRRSDRRPEGSCACAQARRRGRASAASRRWSTSSPIRAEGGP